MPDTAADISASTAPWQVFYGMNACQVHACALGRERVSKANAISVKFDRSPEGMAKARQIAAAAEAMAACMALIRPRPGVDNVQEAIDLARIAIAKYEGR